MATTPLRVEVLEGKKRIFAVARGSLSGCSGRARVLGWYFALGMNRLARKLYAKIGEEHNLETPFDACLVGCAVAFAEKPMVEVRYILKGARDQVLGGKVVALYKTGLLGGIDVTVVENRWVPLAISNEILSRFGLTEIAVEFPLRTSSPLIDEEDVWVYCCRKDACQFVKPVDLKFERFVDKVIQEMGIDSDL